jgi:iron complex outermembrane receptor protein
MKVYCIFLFVIIESITSSAQTDTSKVFQLKQITVTASKFEEGIRTLSPSLTIISQDEIAQNIKPELFTSLEGTVPGFFISERSAAGFGIGSDAAGKISIRGISGLQEVLVVVDGKPDFAGLFGHPLVDSYPSSAVEAVDVIRGPASVVYGSGAMGGVINITTKRFHSEGFSVSSDINYGSFQTGKLNGGLGYKNDKFSAGISINDDYSNGSRPSSGFRSATGTLYASYIVDPIWSLDFNSYINSTKSYDPGTESSPYLKDTVWSNMTRANTSLLLRNKSVDYEGAAQIYFNNGVHDFSYGFHSNDNLLGFSIHEGFSFFENNITTFGGEIKRYGGSVNTPAIDTTVTESALFIALNQKLNNQLFFNGGLRLNNHSVYGTEVIPQFNLQYKVTGSTELNLAVSKGFRSPTLGELFLFVANVNLKPEKIWDYEIGLKQNLLSDHLSFGLTGYLIEGSDFIIVGGIPPNIQNQNVGNLRNRGVEIEAKYIVLNNFSLNANYSYCNMDTKIIGSPEQQGFIEANFIMGVFYLNVNLKSITNLYTSVQSLSFTEKKQSFLLANASFWYKAYKSITIYLKTENLFNKRYEVIDGYPMPGTTVLLGMNYNGIF